MQTVCFSTKTDAQIKRTEPKKNSRVVSRLIFNNTHKGEKTVSSLNDTEETGYPHAKK